MTLVAVLLGALTVGGVAVLSPSTGMLADTADFQPALAAATSTTVVTTVPTTTVRRPATTVATSHPKAPPPTRAQQVLALVNRYRAQAGCAALRDDARLDTAARNHSVDMSTNHYFSHTTPSGVTFDRRELASGYPKPGGENIAMGQTSVQQVMTDWMNSAGHRANILNCQFTAIGIGVTTDGWYWTQDFGY